MNRALQRADVVKLSEEELAFLTEEAQGGDSLQMLAERYAISLLMVTQGKAGVKVWHQGQHYHYPTLPVVSVDTTGAGDALSRGYCGDWQKKACPPMKRSWRHA